MRIAHVITRMIVGGAQENTLFSANGLSCRGHDVMLVTGRETGSEGSLLDCSEIEAEIRYADHLVRSIHPVTDGRALGELVKLFRSWEPQIVHTHSSKAGVLGRIAARITGVPVCVHTLHSLVFHDYQFRGVNALYRIIKRSMVPFTDHYVSVSRNLQARALDAHIGIPSRHSVINSGFETRRFIEDLLPRDVARERLGIDRDRTVIGSVARLFPLKGHGDLLAAARLVVRERPDVLFVLVGDGPLRCSLEDEVAGTGLRRHVQFLGMVDPSEIASAFSSFDIFVHASVREGLARVLPQAILAGIPVVAYDLDGSGEVIDDGVNGFLVGPRRIEALADRLVRLAGDEHLRRKLGGVTADWVAEKFSVETMVVGLEDLYRKLLGAA